MAMAERGGKAENFLCSKQLHLIAKTAIVSFKGANAVVLHRTNIVAIYHTSQLAANDDWHTQPTNRCVYVCTGRQITNIYICRQTYFIQNQQTIYERDGVSG